MSSAPQYSETPHLSRPRPRLTLSLAYRSCADPLVVTLFERLRPEAKAQLLYQCSGNMGELALADVVRVQRNTGGLP